MERRWAGVPPGRLSDPDADRGVGAGGDDGEGRTARPGGWSTVVLLALVVGAALLGGPVGDVLRDSPRWGTATTVFVSIVVQALPFLTLGVVLSGALTAFATPERLRSMLPRHPAGAVCVAGVGGFALPGCECGSVPVARRLMDGGVPQAAALAFLLAAPAINPVVVAATLVAFPDAPQVALARVAASLVCSVAVGLLWIRLGRTEWITRRLQAHDHRGSGSRWGVALSTARGDLVTAGSFLVVGAAAVSAFHVLVPPEWAEWFGSSPWAAVAVMAALAVILSLCSEADAFIASAMTMMPLVPRLVFLVVGPAIDLKLLAMYAGVLGPRFAVRFAPLVLAVAVASALLVGGAVLALTGTPGMW